MLSNAQAWIQTLPAEVQDYPEWETMSADQLLAVYTVCSLQQNCVTLSGRAGSGKTWTVKFIRRVLQDLGCEVRVVATTGVAAHNAGGESTINKLLTIGTGDVLPMGLFDETVGKYKRKSVSTCAAKAREYFKASREDWKRPLVIIVDEISMASSETLVLMQQIVKTVCGNRAHYFVLVGDMRQLAPVAGGDKNEWKTHTNLPFLPAVFQPAGSEEVYAYGSIMNQGAVPLLIENGGYRPETEYNWSALNISLVTNHRQASADGWFVDALNRLGDGGDFNTPEVRPMLSRVWVLNAQDQQYYNQGSRTVLPDMHDALHVYHTNKEVTLHNCAVLKEAKQRGARTRTYFANVEVGSWSAPDIINYISPIPTEQELAIGLKFMCRLNIDEIFRNGTVGEIVELDDSRIKLRLEDGTVAWLYETSIPLPFNANGLPVGSVTCLPGHLAHALTPWKTQGLTVSTPLVYHVSKWKGQHGLFYVVASRVKSPDQLYILVESLRQLNRGVCCDPQVKSFIEEAERNTQFLLADKEIPKSVKPGPTWSIAHEDGDVQFVWVRDYQVRLCPYIENPKGDLVHEDEMLAIYQNGCRGVFVKDKAALAQILEADDTWFDAFRQTVKFVWWKD